MLVSSIEHEGDPPGGALHDLPHDDHAQAAARSDSRLRRRHDAPAMASQLTGKQSRGRANGTTGSALVCRGVGDGRTGPPAR